MTSTPIRDFTDIPLRNAEDLRQMCDSARRASVDLSDKMHFSARMIKAALKKYERKQREKAKAAAKRKGERWIPRPLSWRPRAVAIVMLSAASAARSAGRLSDKCYRVYLTRYGTEIADQLGGQATFGHGGERKSA